MTGDWGGMDGSLHLGKMIYRWWFCHIEGLVYPTITTLVNEDSYGKSPFIIGRSTINGPISIVMLVYQRVTTLG